MQKDFKFETKSEYKKGKIESLYYLEEFISSEQEKVWTLAHLKFSA
jgi:hypothetical protein